MLCNPPHVQVALVEESPLMDALPALVSGGGIRVEEPDIMEAYNQRWTP